MPVSESQVELLSVHQPVYLPWLGFFHKVAVADLFVIFDNVSYSKHMWYNRNKIMGPNGPNLLSVPVFARGKDKPTHKDVQIDNTRNWATKHWLSIESAYKKYPFFRDYAADLNNIYSQPWSHLSELNEVLMRKIMTWFEINTPIVRASDYVFQGEKSALVLDMCIKLKAGAHLFGALGKEYVDVEEFRLACVTPLFQNYQHPVYTQPTGKTFEPYMCALDLLFCHGESSAEIMQAGNLTHDDYMVEASNFFNDYQ